MPRGVPYTGMSFTLVLEAASITVTVLEFQLATSTPLPSGLTATSLGMLPVGTEPAMTPASVSTITTLDEL